MSEEELELRLEEQDLRILKTILSEPLIAVDFAGTYDESIFVGHAKRFAKAVLSYIKAYKVPPTKRVMLEHFSDNPSIVEEVNAVWDAVQDVQATPLEFKYDLDKLKGRFAEQKILSLKSMLDDPPSDLALTMKSAQVYLDDIKKVQQSKKTSYTQRSLKNYMSEFKRTYHDKVKNPDLGRGILTGYSFLDYMKNGMQPAEMMIIGAETAGGKSMLLNNMAIQMWMQKNTVFTEDTFSKGYNVLYFSLEMPYAACVRRTMARVADVPMYGIRDATLSRRELEGMSRASDFIERYPYEFEIVDIPRGVTVEQIEARFNEAQTRFTPDIVVVDYLGLIEDPTAEGDDWLKLGYIAGKLHEFARAYNIVMLTAVQLNRLSTRTQKEKDTSETVGIHRIGRSSLIMHHADIGIQIESRKNEQQHSDLKYHIIKHRDGELGNHFLMKNFKRASLLDPDPPFEPKKEEGVPAIEEEIEDISELLAKHNWGKV